MRELELLAQYVEKVNRTNSTLDKADVIRDMLSREPLLEKLLRYTYDEIFFVFGLTSESLKKNRTLSSPTLSEGMDLFSMLEALHERKYTGHQAIALVNGFIDSYPSYEELIHRVIDRNLKTRVDIKVINSIKPNLIPSFEVALGELYTEKHIHKDSAPWLVSHKLDGCRCLTVIDEAGNIAFRSRQGKEFKTLDALKPSIAALGLTGRVLDGEVCYMQGETEDFQAIMKVIQRKDYTIPLVNLRYYLDLLQANFQVI